MESPAQTAERLGVPLDKLENLIELPVFAEALVLARDNPDLAPEQVWANFDLPVIDPDGLDIDALEKRLVALRALATRGDGRQGPIEERLNYPVLRGRLQRAEEIAARRLTVIDRVQQLLVKGSGTRDPSGHMAQAKMMLEGELKLAEDNE